jgi:hypothetical protein
MIFNNIYSDLNNMALMKYIDNKQDTLISGTIIKRLNGNSLLGSDDIYITIPSD